MVSDGLLLYFTYYCMSFLFLRFSFFPYAWHSLVDVFCLMEPINASCFILLLDSILIFLCALLCSIRKRNWQTTYFIVLQGQYGVMIFHSNQDSKRVIESFLE